MQDILVRAQRIGAWDRGVQAAANIAAGWGGSLTAVHAIAIGLPPLMPYDPGMLVAEAALEVSRQTREAQARASEFIGWAASLGVHNAAWLASAGDAALAVQYVAGWHDLLIAPLDPHEDDPWCRPAGVGKLVLTSCMPTLVLPSGTSVPATFGTVVLAWNGSPAATRALHAARRFVETASRVVVLRGEDSIASDSVQAQALEHWLARHRPDAGMRVLADIGDGGDPTGAALLDAARHEKADLLVMGAYGQSRFSEWVLGGVTRYALDAADRPLLLHH